MFGSNVFKGIPRHKDRDFQLCQRLWKPNVRCIWAMMPSLKSLFISNTHIGEDKDQENYIDKDKDKVKNKDFSLTTIGLK